MKSIFYLILFFCGWIFYGCNEPRNDESLKQEVYETEKAFEKMAREKGIAEAFYFYADDNAVLLRQNDSLVRGKENIKTFYDKAVYKTASLSWNPDFIDVSASGDMAYTYGKYIWRSPDKKGDTTEARGVFHTVWKKQNGSWKYVWD